MEIDPESWYDVPVTYDLIVVGTGFASSFFLHGWLQTAKADARVLVLERGLHRDRRWFLKEQSTVWKLGAKTFKTDPKAKPWLYLPAVGGTSNSWYGTTPRMLPEDFELKTRYGQGSDWPLKYADLEPFYCTAEEIMAVSGPSDDSPFERSRPYPLPPHTFSEQGERIKKARPDTFYALPSARASQAVGGPNPRPACCVNHVCGYCPIDAKFTVSNGLRQLFKDPRVELKTQARVTEVQHAGGVASGVSWTSGKKAGSAKADVVALGANALFNPFLLQRSGLSGPAVGRYLHEQVVASAIVNLKGLDARPGSTSRTGVDYGFARGDLRKDRAAMMLMVSNRPELRFESERWRQAFRVVGYVEDLPQADNRVEVDGDRPKVVFNKVSAYAKKALSSFESDVKKIVSSLPVESIKVQKAPATAGHIQGTARMGSDPADSVVDRHLLHHKVRNLLVLGGSAFPTSSPARPSLTIAALSLWAATKLR